jgi:hypothetical protein
MSIINDLYEFEQLVETAVDNAESRRKAAEELIEISEQNSEQISGGRLSGSKPIDPNLLKTILPPTTLGIIINEPILKIQDKLIQ